MDHILSEEHKKQMDAGIDKDFNPHFEGIFEAFRNSCKRSRQNFKQLSKDLFRALTGKSKKDKK